MEPDIHRKASEGTGKPGGITYCQDQAESEFYKFPCYLRRAAIAEALGKVSSYRSNLANWKAADPAKRGEKPSLPQVGYVYPAMYRSGMFIRTGMYQAAVKVFIRNT